MTSSKHAKGHPRDKDLDSDTARPPSDLWRDAGIGASKGEFAATGVDAELIEGENTQEGDIMNDSTPAGGANPAHRGLTNK